LDFLGVRKGSGFVFWPRRDPLVIDDQSSGQTTTPDLPTPSGGSRRAGVEQGADRLIVVDPLDGFGQ
jgi:hypothetical protein